MTADREPGGTESAPPYLVIDANVVAKWFVDENLSAQARRVMLASNALIAPDFLVTELGSIFREKVLRREMTEADAHRSLAVTLDRVTLVPAGTLFSDALKLALATRRSFYDSLYVALALGMQIQLLTADEKLINALSETYGGALLWLGNA